MITDLKVIKIFQLEFLQHTTLLKKNTAVKMFVVVKMRVQIFNFHEWEIPPDYKLHFLFRLLYGS